MTKQKLLKIEEVKLDESLYPRNSVDWITTARYFNALKSGAKFPPIIVARYNNKFVLVDGAHRLKAFKDSKETHIQAEILEGLDADEIYKLAVKHNSQHGRQFSTQEVTQIIVRLENLGEDEGIISELVGLPISDLKPFVAKRITRITETQDIIALKAPLHNLAGIEQATEIDQNRFGAKSQIHILDMLIMLLKNSWLDTNSDVVMERIKKVKKLLKDVKNG